MSADYYPSVSVILPFQNNASTLGNTLKSILDQDYPKDRFELIMVCDNSNDGSVEIAKAFQESYPSNTSLIFNSIQGKGPARAANQAIRVARGEIVARMDGDALVPRNWLLSLTRAFERAEVAGVEPFVVPTNSTAIVPFRSSAPSGFGPGVGSSFRRSALSKVGYYDESYYHPLFGYFREDADLIFKLEESGFLIVRDANVRVFHPDRKRAMKLIVQQGLKYGLDPLLLKKHPIESRSLLHLKIGFFSSWGLAFVLSTAFTFGGILGLFVANFQLQAVTTASILAAYIAVIAFYRKLSGRWIPQSPFLLYIFLMTFGIARILGSAVYREALL